MKLRQPSSDRFRLPSRERLAATLGMMPKATPFVATLPMNLWLAYSGLTVAGFAWGPFRFSVPDEPRLYAYLIFVHIAFAVGFLAPGGGSLEPVSSTRLKGIQTSLCWVALVGVVVSFAGDLRYGISLGAGLADPAATREAWMYGRSGSIYSYVAVLTLPAQLSIVPLILGQWTHAGRFERGSVIAIVSYAVLAAVAGGSRHGIMTIGAMAWIGALVPTLCRRWSIRPVGFLSATAVFIGLFLFYSSSIVRQRGVTRIEDYSAFLLRQYDTPVDSDHFLLYVLPKSIEPGVLSGVFYFSHGYEGLGLALALPSHGSGLGFGHSVFLSRTAERLGWSDVYAHSYFFRINGEYGFPLYRWATSYVWIASDTTFLGSIPFLGVLGWLLARAWRQALADQHPVALVALGWLWHAMLQMPIIFVPGDIGQLVGFWGSLALLGFWPKRRRG